MNVVVLQGEQLRTFLLIPGLWLVPSQQAEEQEKSKSNLFSKAFCDPEASRSEGSNMQGKLGCTLKLMKEVENVLWTTIDQQVTNR